MKVFTVKYYLKNKVPQKIKFVEDEKMYTVTENKAGDVVKNDMVEVEITDDSLVIVKKGKAKAEPKKDEKPAETEPQECPKVEEPKTEVQTETIETYIFAVSGNKTVVKFSKDSAWIKVDPELAKKDYEVIGLQARKTLELKMANGVIMDVVGIKETKQEAKKPEPKQLVKSDVVKNDKQFRSAEEMKQRDSLEFAKDIVVAYINTKASSVSDIEKTKVMLKELYNTAMDCMK